MEVIKAWLNSNRNYDAGVKIFIQFSKDSLLRRLFSEKPASDFKAKKLIVEMEAMLGSTVEEKKTVVIEQGTTVTRLAAEVKAGKGWSDTLDEVEAALHTQWKPLFDEMMYLCSHVGVLAKAGKKQEAGVMALRILDLDDECDAIYREQEYYLKNKMLPDKKPYGEPCIDPVLIPQKLANHQRYLREYRGKLKEKPDNTNFAAKVKEHEWFVDHYKNILIKE